MSSEPIPFPTGPSDPAAEVPAVARVVGMVGLMAAVLGLFTVVASQYGPRWLPEGAGYLFAAFGVACLVFHAVRDGDPEVRRLYGLAAGALLVIALVVAVVPGRSGSEARQVGHYLLPWGVLAGGLALLFGVPYARHETEEPYRGFARAALLGAGAVLCVGSVVAGAVWPDTLVGPGIVCALLGLGYIGGYLGGLDTGDGPGHRVAVGLGLLGAAALTIALGLAIAPTVLHDGPAALKNPLQKLDPWKVGVRATAILLCLGVTAYGLLGRLPLWVRGVVAVLGLAFAGVFVAGSFATLHTADPKPYLVPHGLLLAAIGAIYLLAGVTTVSDAPLAVLTRRELASYFYSPIAYLVLFAMAFFAGLAYWVFWSDLADAQGPVPEPILRDYMAFGILGAFLATFLVPALTMRLFSEEKRSGTLEVLLTAPVNETGVVLSKFLGAWVFYLLCWVPAGLYLVGLRVGGGQPFDYRPLISLYLAVAARGAAVVGMGLFFSSLTRNQIVAAVFTFAGMMFLLLTVLARRFPNQIGSGTLAVLGKLDFLTLWQQAAGGQLAVTNVVVQASLAVFWLFLTVKVLEVRKWS